MRGLRSLAAVLLFVASVVGAPLHGATGHALAHAGGATVEAAHGHAHGKGRCCPDGHAPCGAGELCQKACAAAVAVLDAPAPRARARPAYAVRFAAGPPASVQGAIVAPDPFPPRPSRIA